MKDKKEESTRIFTTFRLKGKRQRKNVVTFDWADTSDSEIHDLTKVVSKEINKRLSNSTKKLKDEQIKIKHG